MNEFAPAVGATDADKASTVTIEGGGEGGDGISKDESSDLHSGQTNDDSTGDGVVNLCQPLEEMQTHDAVQMWKVSSTEEEDGGGAKTLHESDEWIFDFTTPIQLLLDPHSDTEGDDAGEFETKLEAGAKRANAASADEPKQAAQAREQGAMMAGKPQSHGTTFAPTSDKLQLTEREQPSVKHSYAPTSHQQKGNATKVATGISRSTSTLKEAHQQQEQQKQPDKQAGGTIVETSPTAEQGQAKCKVPRLDFDVIDGHAWPVNASDGAEMEGTHDTDYKQSRAAGAEVTTAGIGGGSKDDAQGSGMGGRTRRKRGKDDAERSPPPALHQQIFHFLEPWECGVVSVCDLGVPGKQLTCCVGW